MKSGDENVLAKCKFFRKMQVTSCKICGRSDGRCRWKKRWFYAVPMLWSECIQHGNPLSGRKRQLVNHKFINKIIEEKPAKQLHRFRFYDFSKVNE